MGRQGVDPMRRLLAALVLLAATAAPARAQMLPNETARNVAKWSSWGTLGAQLTLETVDAFHAENRKAALINEALRLGVTALAVAAIKQRVDDPRPCAPDKCGIENPRKGMPSGHAAMAAQAVEGEHLGWKVGLLIATAAGRGLGGSHNGWQLGAGTGIGLATTKVW
jgi:hypothetical protein